MAAAAAISACIHDREGRAFGHRGYDTCLIPEHNCLVNDKHCCACQLRRVRNVQTPSLNEYMSGHLSHAAQARHGDRCRLILRRAAVAQLPEPAAAPCHCIAVLRDCPCRSAQLACGPWCSFTAAVRLQVLPRRLEHLLSVVSAQFTQGVLPANKRAYCHRIGMGCLISSKRQDHYLSACARLRRMRPVCRPASAAGAASAHGSATGASRCTRCESSVSMSCRITSILHGTVLLTGPSDACRMP